MKRVSNRKKAKRQHRRLNDQGIIVLVMICAVTLILWGKMNNYWHDDEKGSENPQQTEQTAAGDSTAQQGTKSFRFVGVGDNLIHGAIYLYGNYPNNDFTRMYANTYPYTQNADLAYINMETMLMGENRDEYSSYPTFNGPVEILSALNSAGFDWLSTASNHAMDNGAATLALQKDYITANYPNMKVTGSHSSPEDQNTPVVLDVNGIKVGVANFGYGTNGIPVPAEYGWVVDVYGNADGSVNYDLMKQQLDRLKEVSDVQIVAMHWGVEYATSPNQEQIDIANFLNQQGVEVIIGTHPHVIQPVDIIKTPEQETLVYYSLGNFISAQNENDRMVGGMADFILNYDFDDKKTTFSDIQFIPTITWYPGDYSDFRTYTINEWNDELAASHWVHVTEGQDISKQWVNDYVASIMTPVENVEIVTGQ